MSGSDKRIIKTVKLSNDEFSEITPESDLGNIVEQCTAITAILLFVRNGQ